MSAAMIDLETLSTLPNTVILTLGGVKFDPYSKVEPFDPLYQLWNADQQLEMGRHFDDDTIRWWGNQDAAISDEAFGDEGRMDVIDALDQFHKWVCLCDTVWANGAIFDIAVLENLYAQVERVPPWAYYNVRDVRTMFNLNIAHGMDKKNLHNALADATEQAKGIQNIYAELNLRPHWEK